MDKKAINGILRFDILKMSCLLAIFFLPIGCSSSNDDHRPNSEKKFTILGISPEQAYQGDTVTISGVGFDDAKRVLFKKVEAKILSVAEGELKVIVPEVENSADALLSEVPVRVYSPTQYRERPFMMKFVTSKFTLEGLQYEVDTVAHYQVGPGAYFTQIDLGHAEFPLRVYFLTMDAKTSHLKFSPVLAHDELGYVENVVDMGVRKTGQGHGNYFAGVNADFFNMGGDNRILDGMNQNGQVVALPTESGMGNIIIQQNGELFIDELTYSAARVTLGETISQLDNVNNVRKENQLVMYNRFYDKTTETNDNGTEVVIKPVSGEWQLNAPVEFEVADVRIGKGSTPIPDNCAVLSAHGTKQALLNQLKVGDKGKFNIGITGYNYKFKDLLHTMGVKNVILRDGNLTSYEWNERHPRTALGLSADRNKLYMCVVDGRQKGVSVGVTTTQLALIMKRSGVATAFNMDGGGSSTMYAYNTGYNGTGLMNRPVGGTYKRPVASSFFAVADVPEDGKVASIVPQDHILRIKQGEKASLVFYGLNQYGLIVDNELKGLQLSADSSLGQISDKNEFTASGTRKKGIITAVYQGMSKKIQVFVY